MHLNCTVLLVSTVSVITAVSILSVAMVRITISHLQTTAFVPFKASSRNSLAIKQITRHHYYELSFSYNRESLPLATSVYQVISKSDHGHRSRQLRLKTHLASRRWRRRPEKNRLLLLLLQSSGFATSRTIEVVNHGIWQIYDILWLFHNRSNICSIALRDRAQWNRHYVFFPAYFKQCT